MKKHLVLGIMSGTSIDSVDYALCEIAGREVRLKKLWSADFPAAMRAALHEAARGDLKCYALAQLHHDLGRFYAQHAGRGGKPDYVGMHGQTVFHSPTKKNPSMLQLGESAYLVEKLRVPVVNNFRVADMAAGGQGAPLATMFHLFAFGEKGKHVCVNNLGGISNVTSLDKEVMAFDTGPANVLIDLAMRYFSKGKLDMDRDGAWAKRGKVSELLLKRWLSHKYFSQKPPKSTGRELFGEPFFNRAMAEMGYLTRSSRGDETLTRSGIRQKLESRHLDCYENKGALSRFDVVATFTEFTARSLALNYRLHLRSAPEKVILTGGGAANPVLVAAIARELAGVEVLSSINLGWPVQSIEPAAFALLAYLRMTGKAGNLPKTTGAKRAVLLGQVAEF